MKKLMLWLLIALPLAIKAQTEKYKNVDVRAKYAVAGYKLYAQHPLTKENKIRDVFPEKLSYTPASAIFSVMNPFLTMEAKWAKSGQPADFTFKYLTPGVINLADDGNYSINENAYSTKLSYYKRMSYQCPLKVEVYDSENKLVKTLVIVNEDKIFYDQIDQNFLAPDPSFGQLPPAIAFNSSADADSFYVRNTKKIGEELEARRMADLREDLRRAVFCIYDYAKYQKDVIHFYGIEKKSQATYPDLFEKSELFESLLQDFAEPEKKEAAIKGLEEQYNLYTKKLQDGEALPEDVKQMCRYNAAVAAVYINKLPESLQLFTEFYNRFYLRSSVSLVSFPDVFKKLYRFFYVYHTIQNHLNEPVIDVTHKIDDLYYDRFLADTKFSDPRKLAAKKAANPVTTDYNEKRNKDLLWATWLAYSCWNTGNTSHIEPGEYIYKPGTQEIIGQKFLDPNMRKKTMVISLQTTAGNIKEGVFADGINNFKIDYTWEFNKPSGIKIAYLSECNYDFIYNEDESKIIGIKGRELINGEIQTIAKVQLDKDKIVKITKWENKPKWKEVWIRAIKEINHTDTGVVVFCRTYFTGKTNTEKNSSTLTCIYRKSNGKSYVIVQPSGVITEYTYNDNDDILTAKETKRNSIEESEFFYSGKEFIKKIVLIKELNGSLKQREVYVGVVPENLPANTPEYERKKGIYKFSPTGEMIWESNSTQYRTKTNGAWSEWQYFKY